MIARKATAIESIAAAGTLLPDLIIRGLAAGDRLKYYLALLQASYSYGLSENRGGAPNLRAQREASGITDTALDRVIETSVGRGNETVYINGASLLIASMFEEARRMLHPLVAAANTRSELGGRMEVYQRRMEELSAHVPLCADDLVGRRAMHVLTRLTENGHDTLYQLMADLQWELNRLQSTVAMETIDGARVYSIRPDERSFVRAFMKGIHKTASLKFDHPGLNTMAAREGDQLTIQTDLGGAPPLLITIRIKGLAATVNYADPHRSRIRFLQDLLAKHAVKWTGPSAGDGQELITGEIETDTVEALEQFLTDLASRLVFLIDWNKARKRLSEMVGKTEALELLKWAADNNVGHQAFLKCGGTTLIEEALERAPSFDVKPGARLDKWLGSDAARSFLMSVLRITSSALAAGRSMRFVEDEIEAELLRYLNTGDRRMLADAAEHASLISALDDHVRRTLTQLKSAEGRTNASNLSELALTYSLRSDQLIRHADRWPRPTDRDNRLRGLLSEADSAVAALEETSFLLTLLQDSCDPKIVSSLATLAHLVQGAVREYVGCLEDSRDLSPTSLHGDVEHFLLAVDRLVDIGHQAHLAKRALTEKLVRGGAGDMHQMFVVTSLAREFERAATALSRCGPIVRDHILHTRLSR